jgi:membrane-associated phospholipid phosphatase
MNAQKQPRFLRLAEVISLVGSPFLLAALLLLIVSWHATHRVAPALGWASLAALFVTLGPLVLLALAVRAGKVRSLDIEVRAERPWPMLMALVLTVLGLLALWVLGAPRLLLVLLVATLLGGFVALVITLRWKISIHAGGAAGSATVLALLYGAWALPLLLGVAMIGWSRVALGKHTWAQVVVGALISALVTLLVFGVGK